MGLEDIESTLPPGFRFHPSDEELVCHYLYKNVSKEIVPEGTMVEVDLHEREPWELPEDVAKLSDNEWYFFSIRDRKYATGFRANRATKTGYWKATGKDRTVYNQETKLITGMRKTLVFYRGRAPNGMKSFWVMHEFRLERPHTPYKEDWVLCRVFHKKKAESEQDTPTNSNSAALCSSPPHKYQPVPDAFYEYHISSAFELNIAFQGDSSNTLLNLALMPNPIFGDDYGVLLDVGLEGIGREG